MALQFNEIPGNLRVPFLRFEVNSGASPYQSIQRLVLIGQKLSGGTALADTPVLVSDGEDGLFGAGSMLAAMYKIARQNAPFQEIWAVPLADAVGSTKAAGTITVAGAPITTAGSIILYVGGLRISVPVNTVMTNANIATAIAAAVNACPAIQVVATVASAVVTLTANNAGSLGNTIKVLSKYYADDGNLGNTLLTIVQPTGGAGDPSITTALGNMGDGQWDWIVMPYCVSGLIGEIDSYLTSRWGPLSQTYGHCITAMNGSAGTVQALTSTLNSWHVSVMPTYNAPHPIYLWAAGFGSVAAEHLQDAPELSRPLQSLVVKGLLAPVNVADRWSVVQRQSFYYAGASGYTVQGSAVAIDRLTTTYQRNVWGSPDQSWLDVNTIAQLMYGLPYIAAYINETYPRSALVDSNPNNIQGFVTVEDMRNAFVHAYRALEAIGVFENAPVFSQLLIVERNAQDPDRIDTYLPLDHVNALRVLAVNATSYLQYPTA